MPNPTLQPRTTPHRRAGSALALAGSAVCFFLGTGLHPVFWLTWLAPLPVLIGAPVLARRAAFGIAFGAYALGALNMWSYYRSVVPLWLAFVIVGAPSLFFALIVSVYRRFLLNGQTIRATFALLVLWTAYEYLTEFLSPHSTFGNLAYTQMVFLPLIQIASITGIWSISFLIFLFPSRIAVMLAPAVVPSAPRASKRVLWLTGSIFILVLTYGWYRLATAPTSPRVSAALINNDKQFYPSGPAVVDLVRSYAAQISAAPAPDAKLIVLPEKIGRIEGEDLAQADAILEEAARDKQATILVGFEHQPNLNEARLYSPDGRLEATYEKHHMLPAFESHLLPGTARLTFDRPADHTTVKWGVEICKDMDFPHLARQYANDGARLMLVPAWDFVDDGWLHGRMAILRGVESGFSVPRAARQGILTLSDSRGRVLAQHVTGSAPFDILTGSLPLGSGRTFYARTGDWFAWVDLIFAVLLFVPARGKLIM